MTPSACLKISVPFLLLGLSAPGWAATPPAPGAPAAVSADVAPDSAAPTEPASRKKAVPKDARPAEGPKRAASTKAPAASAATAPAEAGPAKKAALAAKDQTPTETPIGCDDDPDCAESVQRAISQSEAQQYAAALQTYEAIYERWPTPWLLINLGRVQQKLNRPAQAIATYQHYLKIAPTDKAQRIAVARGFLKQAEQEVQLKRYQQMLSEAKSKEKPMHRKWWFWTGLGGLAVAGAAAAVGGLAATQGARPAAPTNTLYFSLYHGSF